MRKRHKSKYLIIILILLFISIGFAYLTSTLEIVGIGHLKKTTWKVYFDNVNILEGESLSSNPPTTANHNTTSVTYSVNMNKPGDVYKFNIDIVNNGTVDAMVSLIDENTILTTDQAKYASYSIKYLDGSPIEENNFLGRNSKETLQVIIKYNKDVSPSDLPQEQMSLDFTLSLTYTQAKNADSRRGESTVITDLSGNGNDGVMYGGRINADGSVYLDGVDDYIESGLDNFTPSNDEYSIVIRMKLHENNKTTAQYIFGNWNNSGCGIYYSNDLIKYENKLTGWRTLATSFSEDDSKYHIIIGTTDTSSGIIYIDGVAKETRTYDESLTPSTLPFTIGAIPKDNVTVKNGNYKNANITVTDILVFDRTLTAEEIATDYATNVNPTNTNDMVLRYNFSTNNIVKDLSGNNNNGTLKSRKTNSDGTITLNGSNSYIDCGLTNYNFEKTISVILRAKFNVIDQTKKDFFGNWEGAGGGFIITNNHKLRFDLNNGSGYTDFISDYALSANKWYTMVATSNGTVIKMYLNGKELSASNYNNQYEVPYTANIPVSVVPFIIGGNANKNGNNIEVSTYDNNITISDALIFDRALTKQEVENDYSNTISPSNRENLLLYYHFG